MPNVRWMLNVRWAPALLALAACAADPPLARHVATTTTQGEQEPDCIRYWAEARYRYPGYDHVVTVDNACVARAYCQVSTNVDPDPVLVVIEPAAQAEVLVRRGSPASEFVPRVVCELAGPARSPEAVASRAASEAPRPPR